MPWHAVVDVVLPVFVLMAVGWLLGSVRSVDLALLTDIVVYIASPCLIFASLTAEELDLAQMALLAAGATWIVVSVGLLLRLAAHAVGARLGALYLPAMFMNAGNMLIPLSLFAFGQDGLRSGVTIFVTLTVLQSSLGVTIASGRMSWTEMFKYPHIYSVALALAVSRWDVTLPALISRPVALLGDMAIPMMLMALGLRLRTVRIEAWRGPLVATTARVVGGYAMGSLFVQAVGLQGVARDCLLLASIMPAAVVNFVFAEKYGNESGAVATAIAVSTAVSLVTTPLLLAYGL
jgi:predicted permease